MREMFQSVDYSAFKQHKAASVENLYFLPEESNRKRVVVAESSRNQWPCGSGRKGGPHGGVDGEEG